jgi:uncharacterized Rmd1/YagE family protein
MSQQKELRCCGYCNAKSYDMEGLFNYFSCVPNATITKMDQAIYVTLPFGKSYSEIFYFHFGSIVIWDTTKQREKEILSIFDQFIKNKLPEEVDKTVYESESMTCLHCPDQEQHIDEGKDLIIITKDNTFTKLAISYALAQSVKLSFLENSVQILLESTQPIYEELAQKGSISLSKKVISKKIGILFQEKYSINMHSDVLDIPEIFWKLPNYEPLYIMTAKLQDMQPRQSILQKRLTMVEDLYNLLTNELNVKHSTRVETIIVILITIEIVIGIMHYFRDTL